MLYFDAAYLVRLYVSDPGWKKVRQLAATDSVCCSQHGYSETVAAFHRKLREGALSQRGFEHRVLQFELDSKSESTTWLAMSTAIQHRLTAVLKRLPAFVTLRAADAMHLATAAENKLKEVYSNDVKLLKAASYFGVKGKSIF